MTSGTKQQQRSCLVVAASQDHNSDCVRPQWLHCVRHYQQLFDPGKGSTNVSSLHDQFADARLM